ncbi:hypothetical protein OURE66S_04543 [Oligella ureolytica]
MRMNAYAFISMTNAVLKLSAAYILLVAPVDRLILYSQLLAIIAIVSFVAYFVYVQIQFRDIKYIKSWIKNTIKKYYVSGWNLFGNIAAVARGQGINILINLLFGVALNAAYGVSDDDARRSYAVCIKHSTGNQSADY